MRLIFRLFFNVLAIWAAYFFVPGFIINGGIKEFVVAGILLGLFNLIVKPIVKIISTPLILLTLGLFTLVINAFIVLLVDYLLDFVIIQTYSALFWSTVVIGIVNMVTSSFMKSFRLKRSENKQNNNQ